MANCAQHITTTTTQQRHTTTCEPPLIDVASVMASFCRCMSKDNYHHPPPPAPPPHSLSLEVVQKKGLYDRTTLLFPNMQQTVRKVINYRLMRAKAASYR